MPGTPAEYFARLALQNHAFGDDIQFEGIVRDHANEARFVISQPMLKGTRPSSAEIARYMGSMGFEPVSGQEGTMFYRVADNLAVFDAHEGNLIKTTRGTAPIDLAVVYPDDRLLEALEPGMDRLDDERFDSV